VGKWDFLIKMKTGLLGIGRDRREKRTLGMETERGAGGEGLLLVNMI